MTIPKPIKDALMILAISTALGMILYNWGTYERKGVEMMVDTPLTLIDTYCQQTGLTYELFMPPELSTDMELETYVESFCDAMHESTNRSTDAR